MILVFCPNGHIFESRAISVGPNVRGLSLRGNRETCPICGAMAQIMDGEFDFIDGAVRVLYSPASRLEHFLRLFESLRVKNANAEQVRDAVEKEAPELSPLMRFLPRDAAGLAAYISVLLMLITLIHQWRNDEAATPVKSQVEIERIVKAVIDAQQTSPTPPANTTPPAKPTMPPSPPSGHGPQTAPPSRQP